MKRGSGLQRTSVDRCTAAAQVRSAAAGTETMHQKEGEKSAAASRGRQNKPRPVQARKTRERKGRVEGEHESQGEGRAVGDDSETRERGRNDMCVSGHALKHTKWGLESVGRREEPREGGNRNTGQGTRRRAQLGGHRPVRGTLIERGLPCVCVCVCVCVHVCVCHTGRSFLF